MDIERTAVMWQSAEPTEQAAAREIHAASRRAALFVLVLSGLLLMAAVLMKGWGGWCARAMFVWSVVVCVYAVKAYWRARAYSRKKAKDLGMTDALTGLPNRKGLMGELERCQAGVQEYGKRIRLIDVDLMNLNRVNYEYGEMVGDAVLQDVAALLRRTVPERNPVGRLGGDEFLVIMPEATAEDSEAIAASIREAITNYRLSLGDRGEIQALKANVSIAAYLPEQASLHETVVSAKEATAHGKLPEAEGEEAHAYYHVPRVTLGAFAVYRWQNLSKTEQEEYKLWKRELTATVTERMAGEITRLLDEKAETNWADFVTSVPTPGGAGGGRTYAGRELALAVAKHLGVPYRDVMRADASGPENRSVEPAVDAVIDKGDGALLISDVISSGIVERRCAKKLAGAGAHVMVVAWAAY
jgi:diguanylate cyclase (GGDEF)-like protein